MAEYLHHRGRSVVTSSISVWSRPLDGEVIRANNRSQYGLHAPNDRRRGDDEDI